LTFFRLRFAPFLISRHASAEEDFWQELGQQFSVPHPLRHQLALYRLCSDEREQQLGARASKDFNPQDMAARDARQHLVQDSLGPAPVRVACVDACEYLWAWMHSRSSTAFLAMMALGLGAATPQATPLRWSSSTTTTSASTTPKTLAHPL